MRTSKQTVGGACKEIIQAHVEVYHEHVTKTDSEGRFRRTLHLIDECGGFEKWWKEREGKTLFQVELKGIEWARKHKKPEWFSEEEWDGGERSSSKTWPRTCALQKNRSRCS